MKRLDQLLQQRPELDIWRGGRDQPRHQPAVASGHPRLDALLAGGGWPLRAVSELYVDDTGAGAISLLAPALARLARRRRWIALIAPPLLPCASAFAAHEIPLEQLLIVHPRDPDQRLWAIEQALRAGTCGGVLAWLDEAPRPALSRRLRLAARDGDCCGFLIRPARHANTPSPAPVRLALRPLNDGLHIEILKRQGGWPVDGFVLPLTPASIH